jgi:hypothetical protein
LLLGQAGQVAAGLLIGGFDDDVGQAAGYIEGVGGRIAVHHFEQAIAQAIIAELARRAADRDANELVGRIVGKGAGSVVE